MGLIRLIKEKIQSNEILLRTFGKKPLIHTAILAAASSVGDSFSTLSNLPTLPQAEHIVMIGVKVGVLYLLKNLFLGGSTQPMHVTGTDAFRVGDKISNTDGTNMGTVTKIENN